MNRATSITPAKKPLFTRMGDALASVERWSLVALIVAMIGISTTQVIMRNIFSSGLDWADVAVRHLVLWVGLLGASVAARKNRHLSIDVASKFIPKRFGHLVESLLCLVTAACCGLFLWASVLFARFMYEYGTGTLEGFWALLACLILPISFLGIGTRFFVRIITELRAFISGVADSDTADAQHNGHDADCE